MPRRGSKKSSPVEKPPEEDWAAMYGQPAEPRTIESYEEEWSHWNVQPVEPEELSEPEPPPPSAPPSEPEEFYPDSPIPVRLRKKRQVRSLILVFISSINESLTRREELQDSSDPTFLLGSIASIALILG